ncbi:MAG: PTS sugar transporter subunit IIA [Candidatus Krumholzibacteriia bacterium]
MKNEPLPGEPGSLAGVIVTHAGLATALRDATARVAGDVARLETISNEGLSPQEVGARVRDTVDSMGAGGCIVFVDFRGGSCATSCVGALREHQNVRVLTGVNLPMLIDFVLRRGDHDIDSMVDRLVRRGRDAVQVLKGSAP